MLRIKTANLLSLQPSYKFYNFCKIVRNIRKARIVRHYSIFFYFVILLQFLQKKCNEK